MVRRKSLNTIKIDAQIDEAILGIRSGQYKSSYEAVDKLGLCRRRIARRVAGGLICSHARIKQQLLLPEQEEVLLK